ncbi:LOW QUALITY PROTEIN: NALCN channel auxiliary factor 1 [Aplochiton taeniatus]
MTKGAWTCRQQDDGFKIWIEPRENEKPFTDSERTQRWRLSLASLLFLTILFSDSLWYCAEAELTRTRDKFSPPAMGAHPLNTNDYHHHLPHHHLPHHPHHHHLSSSSTTYSAHSSLRGNEEDDIFIGNSTKQLWRLEALHHDSLSKNCFTFENAEHLCSGLSERKGTPSVNMSDLYLSFCNSYSLLDLFYGSTSADKLNCSLDVLADTDMTRCSLCVQAYQRYDQHAQEKYEDFELMSQKYETDSYSVRTCMEQCKTAYKPWLCSQYFPGAQRRCVDKVPCHQYCLEVQQSCPFILPDNDDLIHGGSPSFICTGLLGDHQLEGECCDVHWEPRMDERSGGGTLKRTNPSLCSPQGASLSSGAPSGPRLCGGGGGRLKFCLLVLVLLHTVALITAASHNSTGGVGAAIFSLEETSVAVSDE